MPQDALDSPFGELHLANKLRLDPSDAARLRAAWRFGERRLVDGALLQLRLHLLQGIGREAGAHAARVDQLAVIVHT
jgi:hypothetical protein